MEHAALDRLLSAAFHGGEQVCRELRLSDEDARYLADHYPAVVQPMGEQWYQVSFEGANQIGA
ncbi:MAG: hypothetical protein ACI3XJ_10505 [Oscillospiraceae bacterium]